MARILVVDDEEQIRDIIQDFLEGEGHTLFLASNGTEALRHSLNERLDLVITDVVMPDMEGIELIRKLGAKPPRIPVIVMSGSPVGRQFFESARIFGAKSSLLKPFSMDELAIAVAHALQTNAQ